MATRHGRSKLIARLRCAELEPRETPAAVTVIDYAHGFARGDEFRGRPPGPATEDLVLTDGPFQARAVWVPDRVHVGAFETSFVFRQEGEPGRLGDGLTFALIGDGDAIWQPSAAGAGLGYQGLADSVAVKLDLVDNDGEGGHSVGVFTGGAEPTAPAVRLDDTPIHLHAQHPIRADIAYNGSVLTLTLTNTVQPDHTWTHQFPVDIPAAVGGPTAFVGFTAGTGELFARQVIDSWTFAEEVPDGPAGQPPQITIPPYVSWVSPGTVALSARVTDDGGVAGLTHAWEIVSSPDGGTRRLPPWRDDPGHPVALTGLNLGYGLYTFRLTVRDAEGHTVTREINYESGTIVRRMEVASAAAAVAAGGTVQFTAVEYDPSGNRITYPLAPSWSVVDGPGTIDEAGRYTAPAGASGTATVQAVLLQPGYRGMGYDYIRAQATVTIVPATPPEITALTASSAGGLTAVLRAQVFDDGGPAGLSYTWEVVSAPPGATAQFRTWGEPASTLIEMTRGGVYTVRLTARDADGFSASREVGVGNPTYYATLEVTPARATVPAGGTVQFTATVRDGWGFALPDARPSWEVVGPGTIDQTGLYTAPADATGTASVVAMIPTGDPRYMRREYVYRHVQIESPRPPDPGLDFAAGFAGAELLQNGTAQIDGDRLRLAGGPHQAGSAFAPDPVDVRRFAAQFEFQVGDHVDARLGDGLALVFQNAGPTALGAAGDGLGHVGIDRSVALRFDLVDNAGEGAGSVGLSVNGAAPVGSANHVLAGHLTHLLSGHMFRVDLTYANGLLQYMVWDRVTGSGAGGSFAVDLPGAVGGPNAYAGFTAGTGELFAPIDVLTWRHVPTDNWLPDRLD